MDLGLLGKETCSARGKSQLSHPVPDSSPLQVQHFLRKIISRINKEEENEAPITALFRSPGSLAEPCFLPYPLFRPFSLPAVPLPAHAPPRTLVHITAICQWYPTPGEQLQLL